MDTHTLTTVLFEEFLQRARDYIEDEFDKKLALPNEQQQLNIE
jgi:hypothetical protein